MGGAGIYPLTIVGEDGSLVEYGVSELVLECDICEGAAYSYFTLDINCPSPDILCCDYPGPEDTPVTVLWTATYYDTCDNVMGSDSGTITMWQEGCDVFKTGDTTFTTPDMAENEIYCECLNP
ncbi:MAG TPA: hypothetical protein PLB32_10595 [Acidobacteriota bacterium]|jgi:hypothetical protein|nr:hypothetical protein [Acidobacteriota bacterium]